jgi:hypothetical protein
VTCLEKGEKRPGGEMVELKLPCVQPGIEYEGHYSYEQDDRPRNHRTIRQLVRTNGPGGQVTLRGNWENPAWNGHRRGHGPIRFELTPIV